MALNLSTSTIEMDAKPVVIAGAGPVGSVLALYLARNDIPVVLVEKADELPRDLRASTFHPPTLDMLDDLDLTSSLISQGLIVREFQFRERATGEAVNFNLARISGSTNHPYRLQCEQYKLTRTVAERLERFDHVEVKMGSEVLGYHEHSDGVGVLIFDGENEVLVDGSFLIGTDGAGSRVRQASGTEFEGLTYPERFLVVSTDYPFEKHFPDLRWVNYVSDPDEWCVMLKTRDLWRVQFPTPVEMSEEELLSDSFIEDRLQRLHAKNTPYEINHRTLYKVHQRVAKTYRPSPRVLLAGDAAHVNNPLGGMGMNGGIHDAFNLGEKLVNILHRNGPMDHLLDLYDAQRRGICVDFIQARTKENKRIMESKDASVQEQRRAKFRKLAQSQADQDEYILESAMIRSLEQCAQIDLPAGKDAA